MAGRRSEFLKRISSVGWGARESVQMLLGAIVTSLRVQIAEGAYTDEDLETVIPFHDTVEALWRETLSTDPPIPVSDLIHRIDALTAECVGPLAGTSIQVNRALEHARVLDVMKKHR